jgi:ion channel-forming bestrophin family protein
VIIAGSISLSRILREVYRVAGVMLVYDTCVAIAYVKFGLHWISMPDIPLAIFGGVITAIIGFRNNSSYARWWEARMLWGQVVNQSRNLGRQTLSMFESAEPSDASAFERSEVQRQIILLQVAYVHALRCQLRALLPWKDLEHILGADNIEPFRRSSNVPLSIQKQIGLLLAKCFEHGWIDSVRWAAIDRSLSELLNAQGGLERIKNTPMPKHYDIIPQVFVTIYCVLLPLGMVASLKLLTPLGSTLVGVIVLALDQIGRDLENPFDNGVHDLPLNAISCNIEIDLRQLLGDRDVPEPEKIIDGVLW